MRKKEDEITCCKLVIYDIACFLFCFSPSSVFKSISVDAFYGAFDELEIDFREVTEGFMKQKNYVEVSVRGQGEHFMSVSRDWNIAFPYNYMTSSMEGPTEVEWMASDTFHEIITLPTYEWILFNVNQFGFYRVKYDPGNWIALTKALKANNSVFPDPTKAQLIDDALNFAKDGFLSYNIAFDLVMELERETSFLTWNAATKNLLHLNHLLGQSNIQPKFQVSAFKALFIFFQFHETISIS